MSWCNECEPVVNTGIDLAVSVRAALSLSIYCSSVGEARLSTHNWQ